MSKEKTATLMKKVSRDAADLPLALISTSLALVTVKL